MAKKNTRRSRSRTGSNGQATESTASSTPPADDRIEYISISQETRRRYLNYALSVITSRALPDVRDGLKPVQRRIMYVMYHDLHLTAGAKPRKCSKISGDTIGNYHPHGDQAVYDALVRLAQDFNLRNPLVDGQGNFGSLMGLPAAAARYTEARLTAIAEQLMSELRYQTVDMRDNYDVTRQEPAVLPARYPNLLVNGASGIAVGMATNLPPHNLEEVIRACIHLIRNPQATVAQLMRFIKGPDFPLGGRIVTDRKEIREAYETGRGSVKVRGEWTFDKRRNKEDRSRLVITSIPYGVETNSLLAEIGQIIGGRKLPQLQDAADETSEKTGLRIVLQIKPGADPDAVMAYLFKHTALEQNFHINSTCLVPDPGESQGMRPARLSLVELLQYFLDFRFETVRRRFEYQLAQLEKRIHILEGFVIIFDGLDLALKIIRQSQGKKDAAEKLMKAFPLDAEQTNAILELQLYRISQLEIDQIVGELEEKQAEAARIRKILKSTKRMWQVIEKELQEVSDEFGDRRRTKLGSAEEITEFDPQAYIVRENTNVVVTRDGWIKRVGRIQSVEKSRVREGDEVLTVLPGNTLDNVVFFASDGTAYTMGIDQIPASSGYGEPLVKHFRMADGVGLVAAMTTDGRFTPEDRKVRGQATPAPYLFIATRKGQVMQVSLSPFRTPSTKVGRRYCRVASGDRVVFVDLIDEHETAFLATENARIIHFALEDVPILSGPGKGVRGIKLLEGDRVLGAVLLSRPSDCLRVRNTNDKIITFGQMKYGVTSRAGKGVRTSMRNQFAEIIRPPIELIDWTELEE